jgi:cell wall-associated NlpC family hydrolase
VPRHIPALAIRAAVVATSTAAAALVAVLPASTAAAAPVAPAPAAPRSAPAAPVPLPVTPVALTVPAHAPVSPAKASTAAVANAMAKLGAPYRWGATGPHAFDCSGLVTWAFKDSGVSLPRTSRAMATVGSPVEKSELRPGDLVFFYQPVSHVGIYIGDGKIVHASNRKSPVKVSDMSRMPFNSARRV